MILGFGVDLLGFASAGALPFPGGIAIVTPHIDIQPPPNLKPILTFPKGMNKLLRIQISAPT